MFEEPSTLSFLVHANRHESVETAKQRMQDELQQIAEIDLDAITPHEAMERIAVVKGLSMALHASQGGG